jgi:hypothetical protein
MSFAFYGDLTEAAKLAGGDVGANDLTTEMQKQINIWIDFKILNGFGGFVESDEIIEHYDMNDSDITELMLENCPVIDGSLTLVDDVQGDSPVTVNSSCYYIDLNTGIIQLLTNKTLSGTDIITAFTKGVKSVKVTYKYGYAEAPDIIKRLATAAIAKWGKIREQQSDADGLKSVKIGDYSESYDLSFLNINSEFDYMIKDLVDKAVNKYYKGI